MILTTRSSEPAHIVLKHSSSSSSSPTMDVATTSCSSSSSSANKYDVICGKNSYNNPGNEFFRKLIQQYRHAYRSTSVRDEKRRIIESVMRDVHRRGGRFLKHPKAADEIPPAHQYEKVSHALRSARAPVVASAVQTKADLRGNVQSLLETQRQLFRQYCREAQVSPGDAADEEEIVVPPPPQQPETNEQSLDSDALLALLHLDQPSEQQG